MSNPEHNDAVADPDVQVGISHLALPLPVALGASVAGTERYLNDIEADGMELIPIKGSRFLGRLAAYGAWLSGPPIHPYDHSPLNGGFPYDWSAEAEVFATTVLSQHEAFRAHQGIPA